MEIRNTELTRLVAVQLGEYADYVTMKGVGEYDEMLSDAVREYTKILLPILTKELSAEDCDELIDFREYVRANTDGGYEDTKPCAMPPDFLRLHSLWMPDWGMPLSENNCGNRLRQELGEDAPDWMKSRQSKANVRIVALGKGEFEMWYGPTKATMPRQATYIPRPYYNATEDKWEKIQSKILPGLVERLAEAIQDVKH